MVPSAISWSLRLGSPRHQGVSEFVYFFAENTKITTKTTRLNKLYFSHARIDINYIEEILVYLYRVLKILEEKKFELILN
jgi:hypothetical protein